jgi:HSP20 family protein
MLSRWDPFTELSRLQDEFFRPSVRRELQFQPVVDIFEEKDAILLKAELPGVKLEDITIHVENNLLTLSGERKFEREEKREGYHRVESSYGKFTRSFALPTTVDADAIDASLDAGVLTLRLPKKAELQPRKIEVKARAAIPAKASGKEVVVEAGRQSRPSAH